jgi:hypothetical protein
MSKRPLNFCAYTIVVTIAVALLCAGCTTSTVKRNTESNGHASIYQPYSQKKSPPATFNGQVVSIEDGDTIVIVDDANPELQNSSSRY